MHTFSLDKLFSRKEWHQAEREKFEEMAGWRYGLVFGVALVLVGWGWDAYELWRASSEIFWHKLLLVAIVIIPLTMFAGSVDGHAHRSMARKIIVWILIGGASGSIALFMSFEGLSAIAALVDPAIRGITLYRMLPGIQERIPLVMLFGAIGGVVAAVLQSLTTSWAWDSSSADYRFTLQSWRLLLLCVPLSIVLGALYDGSINSQVRAPAQIAHRLIQLALTTPPDADIHKMDTATMLNYVAVSAWRNNFSSHYTQHIVDLDSTRLTWAYVDVEFDNGFIWRCQSVRNGDDFTNCVDLQQKFRDWMTQFIRTGIVQCADCVVAIPPPAQIWYTQNASRLGAPQQISMVHHMGGVVIVTATFANIKVDCRFVGANPTVIHDCVSR